MCLVPVEGLLPRVVRDKDSKIPPMNHCLKEAHPSYERAMAAPRVSCPNTLAQGAAVSRPYHLKVKASPNTARPSLEQTRNQVYLNLKFARWMLPSFNCTTSCRHVPAQAFSVFQT